MNKLLLLVIFSLIITSCVPHKDLVYFQGEPMAKENVYKLNSTPYKLQTNDILTISIKSENEKLVSLFSTQKNTTQNSNNNVSSSYFNGYSIDNHGNIRIPYIGKLNVLGYTANEVREKIEIELNKFVNVSNSIFVTVKLAGIKYTILGEIGAPGTNILYQNEVNIIEAIASSGDITVTGDRSKIEIIRKEFDGVKKYIIDITKIDLFDSSVFRIQPNDIIYIRPIKRKSWGVGTTGLETFRTIGSIFSIIATTVLLIKTL